MIEAAHVKSRGAGGPDYWFNVIPLCLECHHTQHKKSWAWMVEQYPHLSIALRARGWHFKLRDPSIKMTHAFLEPGAEIRLQPGFDIDPSE